MAWQSAERVQKNDQGQYRALINGQWTSVEKAQKNDQGQFRVWAPDAAPAPDESASKYARVAGRAASPYALAAGTGAVLGSAFPVVGTALGAGAGAAALGLTDLAATGINALSGAFGGPRIPTGSEAIMDMFPQSFAPETEGQRFLQGVVQGATAGGALGAGSRALAAKVGQGAAQGTTAGRVVNALAAKPGAQAVAGGASGAGVAAAQEAGIENPLALTLIGMGAGVVPFAATAVPKVVGRGIYNIAEPLLPGGKEAIKARGYMKALNDDPQMAEYASNLIAQGYTPEQVAVALEQAPGFATLLATSRDASLPIRGQYNTRTREQFQPRVNQLAAGGQQATEEALATQNALAQQTATLAEQQAAALAQQRQAQAQALIAARAAQRGQATASRGTQQGRISAAQQQQANEILAAQAEAERLAAAAASQARQQQVAIAAEQRGLAGTVPEKSQLEVGQTVTGRRAEVKADVQEKVVTPAYNAAFALAPDEFVVPSALETAAELRAGTSVKINPDLAPKTSETLRVFGDVAETRVNPLTGEKYTVNVPQKVTLSKADDLIQAINQDYGSLKNSVLPGANRARANLKELKAAIEADVKNGVSEEAFAAYKNAQQIANTQVIQPFNKGWLANLEREGSTGVKMQAPEDVVKTILSGQDEASRFVRALGTDETAMSAVRAGILDAYRNEVIRNGVIRPSAHDAFMSNAKYGRALKALDDAGMDIRKELSTFGEKSRALLDRNGAVKEGTRQQVTAIDKQFTARQNQIRQQTKDAITAAKETGAAERSAASERAFAARSDISARGTEARAGISKQFAERIAQAESTYKPRVEELRSMATEAEKQLTKLNQMGIRPEESEVNLARLSANNPDLRQVIAETRQMLETEADFRRISGTGKQSGGGVSELATESAGGNRAVPWINGLQSSVINFIFARLAGKVDTQLAAEIATEALNSSRFSQVLADAAKKAEGRGIGKMLRKPTAKPNLKLLGVSSASSQSNALAPPSQNAFAEQ